MFPAFFQREIDITQIQLMTSRDGVRWERHTREPLLGGGDPGTSGAPRRDWTAGFFAGAGVVSVRPDESSIAVIPCVRTHNNEYSRPENLQQPLYPSPTSPFPGYAGQIALATWRKDGFVYLDAAEDGYFATTPFVYEGGRLKINGWTRYRGGISGRACRRDQRVPLVRGARPRQDLRRLRRGHHRRRRPHRDVERRVRPVGVAGQDGAPAVQAAPRPPLRHLVRIAATEGDSAAGDGHPSTTAAIPSPGR